MKSGKICLVLLYLMLLTDVCHVEELVHKDLEGKIGSSLVSANEEHQSDYGDGVCDNDTSEGDACSQSMEQLPTTVFPKSNPD